MIFVLVPISFVFAVDDRLSAFYFLYYTKIEYGQGLFLSGKAQLFLGGMCSSDE